MEKLEPLTSRKRVNNPFSSALTEEASLLLALRYDELLSKTHPRMKPQHKRDSFIRAMFIASTKIGLIKNQLQIPDFIVSIT